MLDRVKVLALTHGPSVGPGVFGAEVRSAGHELVECAIAAGEQPAHGADAVLVFGGGMHADEEERHPWLLDEHRFLVRALERETPVFGVCLGAQLLAKAAGAAVHRASEPEIGWLPVSLTAAAAADPVFEGAPARFEAFQWHHYTYDVPAGAVELARSDAATQAFRLGNAVGIQFHAEITEPQVEQWLEEEPHDVADPEALRTATRTRIAEWNALGRGLCRRFLKSL
jgi:GMP synthase (glutamine-hydrolysing)